MVVQWLRLCTARGNGWIPGLGTKIPHASERYQKILKILKTLVNGFLPACLGGSIVISVWYLYNNIVNITVGHGWSVILSFILGISELILTILLLYELGEIAVSAKKWTQYLKDKQEQNEDTINSSTSDCETSDEAADA